MMAELLESCRTRDACEFARCTTRCRATRWVIAVIEASRGGEKIEPSRGIIAPCRHDSIRSCFEGELFVQIVLVIRCKCREARGWGDVVLEQVYGRVVLDVHRFAWGGDAGEVVLMPPRFASIHGRTCSLRCARARTPNPCSLRFAALRADGVPDVELRRIGAIVSVPCFDVLMYNGQFSCFRS